MTEILLIGSKNTKQSINQSVKFSGKKFSWQPAYVALLLFYTSIQTI